MEVAESSGCWKAIRKRIQSACREHQVNRKATRNIPPRLNTMDEYSHDFICPNCGHRSGNKYDYLDDCDDMEDDFESWEGFAEFYNAQDYPGLVKYCEAEVARRPDRLWARYELGRAYVLNGQYQEAIDLMTECHRQWPAHEDFQHVALDALFALGKTEGDFSWVNVPAVIRLDAALIDHYYEYLRTKRRAVRIADLRREQDVHGYLAFSEEQLLQALAHDDRFEVDANQAWYAALVKVRRKRARKKSG